MGLGPKRADWANPRSRYLPPSDAILFSFFLICFQPCSGWWFMFSLSLNRIVLFMMLWRYCSSKRERLYDRRDFFFFFFCQRWHPTSEKQIKPCLPNYSEERPVILFRLLFFISPAFSSSFSLYYTCSLASPSLISLKVMHKPIPKLMAWKYIGNYRLKVY